MNFETQPDPAILYRALQARDARFDGMFFVGVRTTGIYCRPVCRARTPRASSCRFFPVASAAEGAGFRPCLLCRPETAPGAGEDGSLERALLAHLRAGAPAGKSVAALTASSGYSGRQLRRLLRERFGVGPVEIIQTERLLFAKRLLQETMLPVIDVARSAGFGSLRRFNALFRGRYGLAPTGLRRENTTMTTTNPTDVLTLRLAFRPPLAWGNLLRYFRRAVAGVEIVVPGVSYARTVNLDGHTGWLRVTRADDSALAVEVPAHLSPVLPEVLARVRRLFDLDANPAVIDEHLAGAGDPFMAACVAQRPGLRVPGAWATFDLALRTILGQQISVAAATTLSGRIAVRFGQPLTEPAPDGLTRLSPEARALAAADPAELASLGLTKARALAVVELAKSEMAGALRFPAGTTHDAAVESLKTLRGIGEWTAQYVALCALRFPDAFPEGDLGLRKALVPRRGAANAGQRTSRPRRTLASVASVCRDALMGIAAGKYFMNDNPVYHTEIPSPIGPLTLRGTARGLTGIFMAEHRHGPTDHAGWTEDVQPLRVAVDQLNEYFAGRRTAFDLTMDETGVGGTDFQRRVWRALREIPHGQTISYGELARRIGQPAAVRAVGLANGRNPLSIVVPCHRVIGANGALTGYGGGMERKRWLLAHEAGSTPFALG